jgi:predicted phosphodiesterase
MRVSDAWSHDVVLAAMCDDIAKNRAAGTLFDFVLVTGDLAFSGNVDEYELARDFLDAISTASGVAKERIFCVPGNHDIDRDRQKLCFKGARSFLESENRLDTMLSPDEELSTLLQREQNYRSFQATYFGGQTRTQTPDGLAYVSSITVDGVKLAIVGLDSAWLANGGLEDHGKLLIGERQAINGLSLANNLDPHIIIAMAHHPFHLLQEFDRVTVQYRVEHDCHFFHCGHLHEPESRNVGQTASGCLTLTAGASFETRQSRNTYSFVTLDLLRSQRTVKTIHYNQVGGSFALTSSETFPIEVTSSEECGVGELALAIEEYSPTLSSVAYYLSALLLEAKSELPIPTQSGHTFGSFALLRAQANSELQLAAVNFMAFRNVLRVFYGRISLADIMAKYGEAVDLYGKMLAKISGLQPDVNDRIIKLENDSQVLAATQAQVPFSHATALFEQLVEEEEWDLLREQAGRHLQSPNEALAIQAKRMVALSLAHSEEREDIAAAIDLYVSLMEEDDAEVSDGCNLATLLINIENFEGAKTTVMNAIAKFPANMTNQFFQIGLKIVEATGDRDFRQQLEIATRSRGMSD